MKLPNTVQVEELIWALETVVALVYSIRALQQAKRDRTSYYKLGSNGRGLLLVRSAWRDARIFLAIQAGFLMIAALAFTRVPAPEATVLTRALTVSVFLLMQLGLTVIMRGITHDRSDFLHLSIADARFERRTSASLGRIEAQGDATVVRDDVIATDLAASQSRADDTEGAEGAAADAASRSPDED